MTLLEINEYRVKSCGIDLSVTCNVSVEEMKLTRDKVTLLGAETAMCRLSERGNRIKELASKSRATICMGRSKVMVLVVHWNSTKIDVLTDAECACGKSGDNLEWFEYNGVVYRDNLEDIGFANICYGETVNNVRMHNQILTEAFLDKKVHLLNSGIGYADIWMDISDVRELENVTEDNDEIERLLLGLYNTTFKDGCTLVKNCKNLKMLRLHLLSDAETTGSKNGAVKINVVEGCDSLTELIVLCNDDGVTQAGSVVRSIDISKFKGLQQLSLDKRLTDWVDKEKCKELGIKVLELLNKQ